MTTRTSIQPVLAGVIVAAGIALTAAMARSAGDNQNADAARASDDPVAQLQRRIDRGEVTLSYDSRHGYLESVLRELHVPVDSQGLVFSKTSFQASRIGPQTPRALYFNDDVYVGWVRGGDFVELASIDARHGTNFYLLPQQRSARPKFQAENATCLQCHQSPLTGDLPGLLMRSVYPDAAGMPVLTAGTFITTDQSPFKERWGGWYMDGHVAGLSGMGNGICNDPAHPEHLTPTGDDLTKSFDSSGYLSGHSDVVALLVLAHQTHMHNLIGKAAYETRMALQEQAAIDGAMGRASDAASTTTASRIKSACEPLVRGLLFSGEAFSGPVEGSTGFARRFSEAGPCDGRGRSLRQLDLHTRLFRYPCSYLIYSAQFDGLPAPAQKYVYRRLWQVLTGRDDSKEFDHLSDDDRDSIYQILLDTKKSLRAYWKRES